MSYRPLVSVVIPTYNRARQVQAALASVMAQTYSEFEIIVIDDGSTDETEVSIRKIIELQGAGGTRVRYFFQSNRGQSAARNKGIHEADGEWIAFLDSDDAWLPEKLELQMRSVKQFEGRCCVCTTDARLIDNSGLDTTAFRESGSNFSAVFGIDAEATIKLAESCSSVWTSTLLARTDLAKQVGGFDSRLRFAEDNDFFFRLSLATSYCYVNRPLCTIDRTCSPAGSACRPWDEVEVRLRGRQAMLEKWLQLDLELAPEVRKIILRNLRQIHSAWTNWYLEHGRYEEARRAVSKAINYEFTSNLAAKWILTQVAPSVARRISPRMRVHY